jgi:predicted Zn-dependent protease with MMP-like domain
VLGAAEAALGEDDPERVLALARRVRRASPEEQQRMAVLVAAALNDLERFAEAAHAAERAVEMDQDDPAAWHELAVAAYRRAEFDRTVVATRRLVELDAADAEGHHLMARALLWLDDMAAAQAQFRRAATLDPEHHVVPLRISAMDFDRIAGEVWRSIPEQFAALMSNLIVAVEPLPDFDEVADGLDPDVMGLYLGGTVLDEMAPPERILIFQHNHENVCADLGALREEIRRTILHEVGHHFGMEHDELPW